jgi:hypothetical protein
MAIGSREAANPSGRGMPGAKGGCDSGGGKDARRLGGEEARRLGGSTNTEKHPD